LATPGQIFILHQAHGELTTTSKTHTRPVRGNGHASTRKY
jgi:hypothetical protein